MSRYRQMQVFAAVVQAGSLAAASRQLEQSPATVMRSIAALETADFAALKTAAVAALTAGQMTALSNNDLRAIETPAQFCARIGYNVGSLSRTLRRRGEHPPVEIARARRAELRALEAPDDPVVFASLLAAAEDWLRQQGMRRVIGPFNLLMGDFDALLLMQLVHKADGVFRRGHLVGGAVDNQS